MSAPVRWSVRGSLDALGAAERARLLDRSTSSDAALRSGVAAILARVRTEGDAALRALALEHDGVALEALEVPREACDAALERCPARLRAAMERAAEHIRTAHRAFLPREERVTLTPGVVVGRRPDPLGRVGVYAPGGRAAYPSSVLMGALPARVAGVREVILCSPPARSGAPSDAVLAAAALAGVDRVFALGGAGAIGALAYGTTSVPRVDRIVGPGNAWVAEAKLQVAGHVGIDSPAGPSELLVLADAAADPAFVARELIAQAEHDPRACAVALAFGAEAESAARAIDAALAPRVAEAQRGAIVLESLAAHGALLTARSADEALRFAAEYAPEHLVLAAADAERLLERVRNAGTVFVGGAASNAFGDYLTGANHILPTGGLARSYSGLSTLDFVRWTTWQRIDETGARALAADTGEFAEAEGLPGHATAARAWEAAR